MWTVTVLLLILNWSFSLASPLNCPHKGTVQAGAKSLAFGKDVSMFDKVTPIYREFAQSKWASLSAKLALAMCTMGDLDGLVEQCKQQLTHFSDSLMPAAFQYDDFVYTIRNYYNHRKSIQESVAEAILYYSMVNYLKRKDLEFDLSAAAPNSQNMTNPPKPKKIRFYHSVKRMTMDIFAQAGMWSYAAVVSYLDEWFIVKHLSLAIREGYQDQFEPSQLGEILDKALSVELSGPSVSNLIFDRFRNIEKDAFISKYGPDMTCPLFATYLREFCGIDVHHPIMLHYGSSYAPVPQTSRNPVFESLSLLVLIILFSYLATWLYHHVMWCPDSPARINYLRPQSSPFRFEEPPLKLTAAAIKRIES